MLKKMERDPWIMNFQAIPGLFVNNYLKFVRRL